MGYHPRSFWLVLRSVLSSNALGCANGGALLLSSMRATFFALFLSLTACAGPIETRVDSIGQAMDRPISFVANPEILGPSANAQLLVSAALVEKGFAATDLAQLSLDVTLSDRPADLSLHSGKATLATASGKKLCAKREYRLGVILTKIADGVAQYQASAAEFHCKQSVEQALPFLVTAALKDMAAPRGRYVVKRPR